MVPMVEVITAQAAVAVQVQLAQQGDQMAAQVE
jgi:hypothetical protein